MYYLQNFSSMDGVWERREELEFEDILPALERRDLMIANTQSGSYDGEFRVVDEDGTVYEYTKETVSPRFE